MEMISSIMLFFRLLTHLCTPIILSEEGYYHDKITQTYPLSFVWKGNQNKGISRYGIVEVSFVLFKMRERNHNRCTSI